MSKQTDKAGFATAAAGFEEGLARICRLYGVNPLCGRLFAMVFVAPEPLSPAVCGDIPESPVRSCDMVDIARELDDPKYHCACPSQSFAIPIRSAKLDECRPSRKNVARMTIDFASMSPRAARWGLATAVSGSRARRSPHGSAVARDPSSASKCSGRIASNC
jgi:hypothetical protein